MELSFGLSLSHLNQSRHHGYGPTCVRVGLLRSTPARHADIKIFEDKPSAQGSKPIRDVSVQFSSNIREVSNRVGCSNINSEIICVLSSINA